MAVVYPLANGNWSTITWYSGGVPYGSLPLAGDDVYADGKTVTIDTNVTVANLYTTLRSGGTVGGVFNVVASGLTITANIIASGTVSFNFAMVISATGTTTIIGNITAATSGNYGIGLQISAGTVNVTGNVSGGGSGTINGTHGISVIGSSILNLVGNVTGGASSTGTYGIAFSNTSRGVITGNATGGLTDVGINVNSTLSNALVFNGLAIASPTPGIRNATTGTTTINGNQTAVGNAGVYLILNASTGVININGDCLGALSATPSLAYILNNAAAGVVNINGNVTARSVSPTTGTTLGIVNNNSTGTINVSTNVSGGSVANTIGMSNTSTGTINVTGNITGGTHATNTPAIYSTTAGTIDVTGTTTAGLYPALFSTNINSTNILRGNITNALGVPAYFTYKVTISPTAVQTATMQTTTNGDRLFSTSNVSVGAPAVTNVRSGIVYGSTNELTGTMIVPTPANVRNGVPTDNTVGTADLTISEFWDINASTLTTGNSIGDRLRNCNTVSSNGDQLAGSNV
jgi:hypothetical protein